VIYLDHAATTPVAREVLEAMLPFFGPQFGNPNSLHLVGRSARRAVDTARAQLAALLHAAPHEIVFTGGGTAADNLAVFGVTQARKTQGCHVITSRVEHHAVLHACRALERRGFELTTLPVDVRGRVNPNDVSSALRDDTVLVSIMLANNEVGTLQPIAEIGKRLRDHPASFHTDAVQAVGHLELDVEALGVDLLSLSAHKFYGPKGVGALFVREGVALEPLLYGGGQEQGLRGGTENVAGIVGLGEAARLAQEVMEENETRVASLRQRLVEGVCDAVPGTTLTGHPTERLPGSASFCFDGLKGESLLLELDMYGVCASTGAACAAGRLDPSHVLLALGLSKAKANGSLRLTLGRGTTKAQVERVLALLPGAVEHVRRLAL